MPSPNAVQLMLPAIEKLAASPKAEQTAEVLQRLGALAGKAAAPAQETPWQRLIKMAPKEVDKQGVGMLPNQPRGKGEHVLDFFIEQPNKSAWGATLTQGKGNNPFEAYLQYLGSGATKRISTGAGAMEEYKMDIASPAQRKLPLREKLSPEDKAARPARPPEEREPGWKYPPQPSIRDKQAAFDKLADLLRRSGHKELSFVAEPGERPRLYEMLTGYKAQPTKRPEMDVMSDMMRGFPGRQSAAPAAAPRLQQQVIQGPMHINSLENALGLSADEAVEYGLAKQLGTSQLYEMTEQGRHAAANWGAR